MKAKTSFIVLTLALLGLIQTAEAQSSLPRCNVGADPVNTLRQPSANEEVIYNPADHAIRVASGSGHVSYCILQAGVPVVIDKATGEALWVYGCGNPIHSRGWFPKRSPAAASVAPQTLGVHHTFDPVQVNVSGAIDLNVQGAINAALNPPVAKAKGHSVLPWVIAGIATGAAIGICIAKCGDDKPEKKKEGTPPGGVTGPAFSRGFSFTLGVLGSH